MRLLSCLVLAAASLGAVNPAIAAEGGFAAYGLGSGGFGAGVMPPPGFYLTTAASYFEGRGSGPLSFGGETIDLSLEIKKFISGAVNLMTVPDRTFLGGTVGFSIAVPFGYVELEERITARGQMLPLHTEGSGLGDVVPRVQLGWHHGDFHHLAYVQGLVPTGRYDLGFKPNIGLNRWAIDVGWGFTWIEPETKVQLNGVLGFTYSFENEATHYKSGEDFHLEWAIGREFGSGLILGVVGYNYRQLTGDSGEGAVLGPLKGSVDAIGPGISYATQIGSTPVILNARYYQEFNAERRLDSSLTMLSATFAF